MQYGRPDDESASEGGEVMPDNSDFAKSIQDATLQITLDMKKKVKKACLVVETQAKQDCPVDMGILQASITSEVEMTAEAIIGRIGSNEEYAPYVNNGTGIYAVNGDGRKTPWAFKVRSGKYKGWHITVGQRPRPFLTYAILFNRDKIARILGD